jgi:hypothetical protein
MSSSETTPSAEPTESTDAIEVGLWPWQFDAVFRNDQYRIVFLIGGRGSGKTFIEKVRMLRWSEMATELPWGIFASTESQLQTVLAPIREALDDLGIEHVYESEAPPHWRKRWKRDGVKYPPTRLRSRKFWIWEDGTHVYTASLVNNAYTRAKSIDFNGIYLGEFTEPGVRAAVIETLFPTLRCGKARLQPDGTKRCAEPGHIHQLVAAGNEPLNDPSHWVYKMNETLLAREAQRQLDGQRPFYRIIFSRTDDNPATGDDYIDGLRAALDPETFEQQTNPQLRRNTAALSYHQFSEKNILGPPPSGGGAGISYGSERPLHIWFDFNATPAVAGWGHDLRYDEVPAPELRSGHSYFGVNGELFSDSDAMVTEQVALALLEDPTKDSQCNDCGDLMDNHRNFGAIGFLCTVCGWRKPDSREVHHCSGKVRKGTLNRKYLHATPNWRGLLRHRGMIYVYGDATGGATHADAREPGGSIKILRDVFEANLGDRVEFRFKTVNPAVPLRLLAMNRMLCAADGARSLFFAPHCTAHIDDAREVVPDAKGHPLKKSKTRNPLDTYWKRTHALDACGYFVDWRWPAIIPKASGLPEYTDGSGFGPLDAVLRAPR